MSPIDKAMQNTLMIIIIDTEKENGINKYTLLIMIMMIKYTEREMESLNVNHA